MLDMIIVGGGISGLATALRADQSGLTFRLLESAGRLGGVISSEASPEGVSELGPDALMLGQPAIEQLLEELDLRQQVLSPSAGVPWMARGGRLFPLPAGFRQIAPTRWLPFALTPLLSLRAKLRVLADLFLPAWPGEDQTLAQLVTRRMGAEVLERLAQPLIAGIYAADPQHLSLAATMPHLLALEKRHGSLLRGFWSSRAQPPTMGSLPQGLGQLTAALQNRLNGRLRLSTPARRIVPENSSWTVHTPERSWRCRRLVLATSAPHCQQLLETFDRPTAQLLGQIHCRSVAILNQFYYREQLDFNPGNSQGFLLPLSEKTSFSAVSLAHKQWPDRTSPDLVNLRVHLGGAGREPELGKDDASLISEVSQELKGWLKIRGRPLRSQLTRHPQVMPEYRIGHGQLVERILAGVRGWPGLQVAGNWLGGVGIGHCVARAQSLSQEWELPPQTSPAKFVKT